MTRINQFDDRTSKEIIKLVRRYRERIFDDVRPESSRFNFRPDHIAAKVSSVIPPATIRTGTFTPGVGDAIFNFLALSVPEIIPIGPAPQPVWNYSLTQTYPQGTVVVVHRDQHGNWIIDNDSPPSIRFILTSDMINRQAEASVTWLRGHAPNTGSMELLKVGDTVTVSDPHNLWPEALIGATGAAYLEPASTGENEHGYRWEVEECSLPINEIEGTVTQCLKKTDETATAMLGTVPELKLRCSYPNVDLPPEFAQECAGTGYYEWSSAWDDPNGMWTLINGCDDTGCESTPPTTPPQTSGDLTREMPCEPTDATPLQVEFKNPWGLYTCADKKVILRRITNTTISNPGNESVPLPPSVDEIQWEVVSVEEPIARHATFTKSDEEWELAAYWDGCDPSLCGDPTVVCEFDCSCLKNGDKVYATYDPEADQYRAVSSASAMLGPPETKTIPVTDISFSGCGITYQKQSLKVFTCNTEPTLHVTYPDLIALPVLTSAQDTTAGLVFSYATAYVCQVGPGGYTSIPYTDCAEPPECSGYCGWEWFGASWDDAFGTWVKVEDCVNLECLCQAPTDRPISESDTTRTFECGVERETPDPPDLECGNAFTGNYCKWKWSSLDWEDEDGVWELDDDTCKSGCGCPDPPDTDPTGPTDLIRYKNCVATP